MGLAYPIRRQAGDDRAATTHRAEFRRLGLETHLLTAQECASQQAVILVDDSGDANEERLVAIGISKQTRTLFVVHVVRGERDRIISARVATSAEESFYEQGS